MPIPPGITSDVGSLPEQFGPYRILKRLGQGGMGTVYLAFDNRLKRKVALKVCHHAGNAQAMERFRREAMAAASLRHANLCPVFDCDVVEGTAYFTMAFIEGPMLDQWVAERNGLGQREAAVLVRKLAFALHYAHERGVVHRDLKPTNIAMDKNEPVVLDFGLAQYEDPGGNNKLTRFGTMLGTPTYIAPEQVAGDIAAMGPWSDVYSLGVILYELLTGQVPFDGSPTEVMAKILVVLPQPPRTLRPDVDLKLETICLKALAKKPAERWPDMQDFAAVLAAWTKTAPATKLAGPLPGAASRLETVEASYTSSDLRQTLRTTTGRSPLVPQRLEPNVELVPVASIEPEADAPIALISKKKVHSRKPGRLIAFLKVFGLTVGFALLVAATVGISVVIFRPAPTKVLPNSQPRKKEPGKVSAKRGETESAKSVPLLTEHLTNSFGMEFVLVPKGKFLMGGGGGTVGDKEVEIPYDFYLGTYEVTQGEWEAVTGQNPSYFSRKGRGKEAVKYMADAELKRFPVEMVSWDDAQHFLEMLNWRDKDVGWVYRLPTEAEWEYACRGGPSSNTIDYAFDFYLEQPTNTLLREQANVSDVLQLTCKVGSYQPNRLGLYDMHGNAWEWCDDAEKSSVLSDSSRVFRGGGWYSGSESCRAASRLAFPPSRPFVDLGLRVARVPAESK